MTMQANSGRAVKVSLGGECLMGTEETWNDLADQLVKKYGGVPSVELVSDAPASAIVVAAPAPVVVAATVATIVKEGEIDTVGQARSVSAFEAMRTAGFAPAATVYTRGMRVNSTGVANARKFRAEYDAKPLVVDYCSDVIQVVEAEERSDFACNVCDVQMAEKDGTLQIVHETGPSDVFMVEAPALPDLVRGLVMPPGAASYLGNVWPELRAGNINAWTGEWAQSEIEEREDYEADLARWEAAHEAGEKAPVEPSPEKLVLRTRVTGGEHRSMFAVVSKSYTAFDVDKIAKAIQLATPADARGTVTYDGYRARFEVLFHSDVQPEDYVAGEFFRAGVIVRTDDTGGGSLRGNAVVWQNLCLNLIIIDEANQDLFQIRHIGDVEKMAASFREGFATGLAKLDHFVKAWGYASRESLAQYLPKEATGIKLADAIPGFFNGIIQRELVPVRGKAIDAVPLLVKAWEWDRFDPTTRKARSSATVHHNGGTRAALANAFTRYAHTADLGNPWFEDQIQKAAGAFLQSGQPIPYLALPQPKGA